MSEVVTNLESTTNNLEASGHTRVALFLRDVAEELKAQTELANIWRINAEARKKETERLNGYIDQQDAILKDLEDKLIILRRSRL